MEMVTGRKRFEEPFMKALRKALKRYHLSVADDQGYFYVTDTGMGGFYREVPWRIVAKYQPGLHLPGPRLINRRAI
jgi:hypothetical protein